jgi:hypothetical protein
MIVNDDHVPYADTIANRVIASAGSGRNIPQALMAVAPDVAESHLVDADGRRLLGANDYEGFLLHRSRVADSVIRRHVRRMAEWGARDGRSMADILRAA